MSVSWSDTDLCLSVVLKTGEWQAQRTWFGQKRTLAVTESRDFTPATLLITQRNGVALESGSLSFSFPGTRDHYSGLLFGQLVQHMTLNIQSRDGLLPFTDALDTQPQPTT